MRDTKGRFRVKEIKISIPSESMILNEIILFFFLSWTYVSIKFGLGEKIYKNGDNKY